MSSPGTTATSVALSWPTLTSWVIGISGVDVLIPPPEALYALALVLLFTSLALYTSRAWRRPAPLVEPAPSKRPILPVFVPLLKYLAVGMLLLVLSCVGMMVSALHVADAKVKPLLLTFNALRYFVAELCAHSISALLMQATLSKRAMLVAVLPTAAWAMAVAITMTGILIRTVDDFNYNVPRAALSVINAVVAAFYFIALLTHCGRPALRPWAWYMFAWRLSLCVGLGLASQTPADVSASAFDIVYLILVTLGFPAALYMALYADTAYWRGFGRHLPSFQPSFRSAFLYGLCGLGDIGVGMGLRAWGDEQRAAIRATWHTTWVGTLYNVFCCDCRRAQRADRLTHAPALAAYTRSVGGSAGAGATMTSGTATPNLTTPLLDVSRRRSSHGGSYDAPVASSAPSTFRSFDLESSQGAPLILPRSVSANSTASTFERTAGSRMCDCLSSRVWGRLVNSLSRSRRWSFDLDANDAVHHSSSRWLLQPSAAYHASYHLHANDRQRWQSRFAPLPDTTVECLLHALEILRPSLLDFAYLRLVHLVRASPVALVLWGRYKTQSVAIKVFRCDDLTPALLEKVAQEAQVLRVLRSTPNVLSLTGVCYCPPDISLITEWCPHGDLRSALHAAVKATQIERQRTTVFSASSLPSIAASPATPQVYTPACYLWEAQWNRITAAVGNGGGGLPGLRNAASLHVARNLITLVHACLVGAHLVRDEPVADYPGAEYYDERSSDDDSDGEADGAGLGIIKPAVVPHHASALSLGDDASRSLQSSIALLGGTAADVALFPLHDVDKWDVSDVIQFSLCWQFATSPEDATPTLQHRNVSAAHAGIDSPLTQWHRRLKLLDTIARTVLSLHQRQPAVWHRRLTTAHVMLTSSWEVRLSGFCDAVPLSPMLQTYPSLHNPGQDVFALAPEELRAAQTGYRTREGAAMPLPAAQVCLASDVYSLGILMWEVLTGGTPMDGLTPTQIRDIAHGDLVFIRPPIPDVMPRGFAHLLRCCWHPDPAARPSSTFVVSVLERYVKESEQRMKFEDISLSVGDGSEPQQEAGAPPAAEGGAAGPLAAFVTSLPASTVRIAPSSLSTLAKLSHEASMARLSSGSSFAMPSVGGSGMLPTGSGSASRLQLLGASSASLRPDTSFSPPPLHTMPDHASVDVVHESTLTTDVSSILARIQAPLSVATTAAPDATCEAGRVFIPPQAPASVGALHRPTLASAHASARFGVLVASGTYQPVPAPAAAAIEPAAANGSDATDPAASQQHPASVAATLLPDISRADADEESDLFY